jgi:hypothetical protein
MASFNQEVVVRLKDEFSSPLKSIESTMNGFKDTLKTVAGVAGVGLLIEGFKKATDAYLEHEKAITELTGALQRQGISSKFAVTELEDFAEAMQHTTVFSDDAVLSSTRLLTQYGIFGAQLKQTTKAAADLSAALGIDLHSSTMILAKAFEGNLTMLQRYGIHIDEATFKTQGFKVVLDKINSSGFGGAAEAQAKSFSGQLSIITHQLEDIMKNIGGRLVEGAGKTKIFDFLKESLEDLAYWTKGNKSPLTVINHDLESYEQNVKAIQDRLKNGFANASDADQLRLFQDKIEALKQQKMILTDQQSAESKLASTQEDSAARRIQSLKDEIKLEEDAIESVKRYAEEYPKILKYLDEFDTKNSTGFKRIEAERKKDLDELERYYASGLMSAEQYENQRVKIHQKADESMIKQVTDYSMTSTSIITQFAEQAKTNVGAALTGLGSNISSFMGTLGGKTGMIGQVMGAAIGVGQAIASIFDMFSSDTRTYFAKLTDELDAFNRSINEVESRMKNLRSDEQMKRDKLKGSAGIATGGNDEQTFSGLLGFNTDKAGFKNAVGQIEQQMGNKVDSLNEGFVRMMGERFRNGSFVWEINDDGDFTVSVGTDVIALKRGDTGQWQYVNGLVGWGNVGNERIPDRVIFAVFELYFQYLKRSGLIDLASFGVSTSQRNKGGSTSSIGSGGSGTSSRSFQSGFLGFGGGSSSTMLMGTSLGMPSNQSSAPANININVSAMDSQDVKQFLLYKLAPIMREVSGRSGVPLINIKGVTSNI